MRPGMDRAFVVVSVMGALTCSCASNDDREVLPPVVLGMLETAAPIYDDGEAQIFQVGRQVRLPFRSPKDSERPSGKQDPYPRLPFHHAVDSRMTVRFTLSNLEDKPHDVELLIDPWNEFVHYVPGSTEVRDDESLPNFSGIQRMFVLPPNSRVQGIITPDDIIELATDLTVAMALKRRPPDAANAFAGAVLYNRTFNVQNRSSEPDPILAPWMPSDKSSVAAVIGFDLGLRTAEPAKVAVELVVDLDDLKGDRIVLDGEQGIDRLGRPGTALTPPASTTAM